MTRIGFSGFAAGETLTASVTKDGAAKGTVTVSAWRQNDDGKLGEIAISVTREPAGTIAAPEPIRLHAVVTSTTGLPLRQNGDVTADAMYDYDVKGDGSVIWKWDQQLHELEFVWTIHSGTVGMFDKVSRLPSQWRAKNVIHGPYADFMLETPGDHDVTCEVYRTDYSGGTQISTLIARKTITIADVLDPDTLYAGTKTCVVSSAFTAEQATSNAHLVDADAPTGSVGVNSISDFLDLVGGPEMRILLKRGETFEAPHTNSGGPKRTWGAYGTGARPKMIQAASTSGNSWFNIQRNSITDSFGYWKFEGVEFKGLWDEKTELENGNEPVIQATSPGQVIMYDCTATGIERFGLMAQREGTANGGIGEAGESAFWLYDTYINSFQNYGLFMATQWLDIILVGSGCRRASDATMNVPEGKWSEAPPANRHGPLRALKFARIVARATDWYNRSGWPETILPQPCWRIGTHNSNAHTLYGDLKWGNWIMQVHHSVFEGGGTIVNTSTENNANPILPANILFKHNALIFDLGVEQGFGVARGGTSFIENVILAPAIARAEWDSGSNTLASGAGRYGPWKDQLNNNDLTGNPPINRAWPIRFHGNLVIDDKTPIDAGDEMEFYTFPPWTGLVSTRDNHVWGPNYATPETTIGALEAAFTIASYNTHGTRFRDSYQAHPANRTYTEHTSHPAQGITFITPGGQVTVRRPATGDAAIGGAAGAMSRLDLLGMPRPPAAAAMPLEPAS